MFVFMQGGANLFFNNAVSQIKFEQIPMMDRTACMEAANTFKNNSTGFAIMCVSSNTGEVIKIREGKDKP